MENQAYSQGMNDTFSNLYVSNNHQIATTIATRSNQELIMNNAHLGQNRFIQKISGNKKKIQLGMSTMHIIRVHVVKSCLNPMKMVSEVAQIREIEHICNT